MKTTYSLYLRSQGEKTKGRLYAMNREMTSFSPSGKYRLELTSEAEAKALQKRFENVLNLKIAKFI